MDELKLSQADIKRIKEDIRLTTIIGLIFTVVIIVVALIIPAILLLFFKPADGFVKRGLIIIGTLSIPFIAFSWKNLIKYIDMKVGNKINFKTTDFEIKKEKEDFILEIKSPMKLKFDIYDKLPSLLKLGEPITIETTKLSKTLLFISQDKENLLETVEKQDDF